MDDNLIGIERATAGGAKLLLLGPSSQLTFTFPKRLFRLLQILATRGENCCGTGEVTDYIFDFARIRQIWCPGKRVQVIVNVLHSPKSRRLLCQCMHVLG